jgi:hypothetical protein
MKCFCAGITCQGDNFLYRFTRSTRFPSQIARSPFRSWICMSSDRRLFWSAFPDPVCRVQFSFALRSHAGYCNWPRFAANFSSWFWSRSRRAIFFFLLSRSAVKVSPKIFGSVCKSWCGSPSCCCLGLQDLIIIFLIQRQVLILILVCVTYPSRTWFQFPSLLLKILIPTAKIRWSAHPVFLLASGGAPCSGLLGFVLLPPFLASNTCFPVPSVKDSFSHCSWQFRLSAIAYRWMSDLS